MSRITEEIIPILKAANVLDGAKKRFILLLAEKVKGRDPDSVTTTQVMMELITEDHISFVTDENDNLFVIFPNGERCELPKQLATIFIKNGLKNKIYCETVLYNRHVKYMDDDEEKAVDEAKKHTRLDEKKILLVIKRLHDAILQIKDRINTLNKRSELEPKTKKDNDEKIAQLMMDIAIYEDNIRYLENIIKEYKEIDRRKTEEEKRDKVAAVAGTRDNPGTKSKPDKRENPEDREKEEEEDEDKDDLGILPFIMLGGLGLGITLALNSCSLREDKLDPIPPSGVEESVEEETGKTTIEDETIEEESEVDTSEIDRLVYDETFESIVETMHPGMISREREDAFDGVNYDHQIMGESYEETYDFSQTTYVEPGADFINRYNQYRMKYENGDTSLYDQMVEDGIALLEEYSELVKSSSELVDEHNETTQEAIDSGVRSYNDYYENQKIVTVQQGEDLTRHLEEVEELMEVLSQSNYKELQEGIKSGKYSIDIKEGGLIVIYNNETHVMVYSTAELLSTSKGASEVMKALSGGVYQDTNTEGMGL